MRRTSDISQFADKTTVITGGASGIGLSVARYFSDRRARVFILDVKSKIVEDVDANFEERVTLIQTDLGDPEAITHAFASIEQETRKIKVLVNNAGIGDVDLIETEALETWQKVMNVNLTAPFLCVKSAIPMLRAAGSSSIVNVASIAGKRMSYNGGAAYTASKSGLLGFTRHAAYELARDGIRVNAVCPGPTLTPMILDATTQNERVQAIKNVPLQQWVAPDQIAEAVGFLAGDASSMSTGITIDVDGGFLVSSGAPFEEYFERRTKRTA